MKETLFGVAIVLLFLLLSNISQRIYAQAGLPPPPMVHCDNCGKAIPESFADVVPEQNLTVIILRDTKGADQVIVTTFYKTPFPGLSEPILLSVTDVVGALKDTAVGAKGAPDPKQVTEVHLSLVKITDRMVWKAPLPTVPPPIPQPKPK